MLPCASACICKFEAGLGQVEAFGDMIACGDPCLAAAVNKQAESDTHCAGIADVHSGVLHLAMLKMSEGLHLELR